ncbi:fungal-specific transcription factor domain-containing protein [Mycena floridula]|nr:fungal-specific transcription factor domain-containing protein [Mycena floridula]
MSASAADATVSPLASSTVQVRARVWRACEVCRKRKVKCNGQDPCSYCVTSGKKCSFTESGDNGVFSRQQGNSVDNRLARVEENIQKMLPMTRAFEAWMQANKHSMTFPFQEPKAGPSQRPLSPYKPSAAVQHLVHRSSGSPLSHRDSDESQEPENWSDRFSHLTKDSYGNLRYTGGTSSFMLVDALTSLRTPNASPSSVLSSSTDIQLPFFHPGKRFHAHEALPRPETLKYPPAAVADDLVTIYFFRIHKTFPILHQHLFVDRYTQAMKAYQAGTPSTDHAFLASMFAVFACGACLRSRERSQEKHKDPQRSTSNDYEGMEYYEKAQLLFWMGSGGSQVEHVQCLALLAICNANWNTLAQSWIKAGQAIRRAQDLGLHRVTRRSSLSDFEKELRRRIWWCVYGLDKVLSIALGRPCGAHDDDCNIEMPTELDDTQLLDSSDGKTVIPDPSSYMVGYIALLRIYVIAGKISRLVQFEDHDLIKQNMAVLDNELNVWYNTLPASIRVSSNTSDNPQMLILCLITFFVYYSSIINLHRPFIPDQLTTSSDLTSFGHCLTAARSCIKIGELTQQILPTSHHLAFAVQYITLSGVLLLRSVLYVDQPNLVSAIIQDAEKCIGILERMEEVWPASRRCREIVSDLLVVVKTKLYGGATAINDLRASQRFPELHSQHQTPGAKRKRSPERENPEVRPRLEGYWQGEPVPVGRGPDPLEGRPPQRVSNLRTSSESLPHSMGPPPTINNNDNHVPPPRISFDLNTPDCVAEGLPFSGYDFLGDDLSALLGNVIKPPPESDRHDHNQVIWQAFNNPQEAPFGV